MDVIKEMILEVLQIIMLTIFFPVALSLLLTRGVFRGIDIISAVVNPAQTEILTLAEISVEEKKIA
jgi:hypothetical protein